MAITLTPGVSIGDALPPAIPDPEPIADLGGIPQSGSIDTSRFGENPWDIADAAHDAAVQAWRRDSLDKVDGIALDPDGFFKDKDLSFARTPQEAQRLTVNDAFLALHNDGNPLPATGLDRQLFMQEVAIREFEGRGAKSEEEFFGEVVKSATKRKDAKDLARNLTVMAFDDAMLPSDKAPGFAAWKEMAKAHAGYDPAAEADYFEAFQEVKREAAARVDAYRPELVAVWRAFKANTPVTPVAYEAWKTLAPEQRGEFLEALAIRARALPEEEQKTFWQNMNRQTELGMKDFYRQAGESFLAAGLDQNTDPLVGIADAVYGTDNYAASEAGRLQAKDDFREQRNFAAEVRKISREDYDPLKSAWGGKAGFWEGAAYQTPAVVMSSLSMAVPYVGAITMAFAMEGQAYESTRERFLASGLDDQRASDLAEGLAPFIAIPQMALEKVQFGMWSRKLPGFATVMDNLGDRIANRLLRGAVKTVAIGAAETGVEVMQDAAAFAVQDIGAALVEDIPGVQWTGEGGALSGLWAETPEIFVTMLPLAILGAAGGLSAEARAAAFRQSTPLERRALGFSEEASAAIDAAAGPSSLQSAITNAWETRDPNSKAARAAGEELKTKQATQARAQANLEALGYAMPKFIQTADGITVIDGKSGDELGQAPDLAGAIRISRAHSVALDDLEVDQVAYLGTLMEAARAAVELDPNSVQEVNLGEVFDPEKASPEMAARFAAQVALKEQAEGGSGDVARSVLGYSVTSFAQGLRTTVNRLFSGAAVTDVFHETFHGLRRQARAAGTITRADEIALLRSLDQIFADRKSKDGTALRFIPEGMTDDEVSETLLDEAISEIGEMELLRTRKGAGKGKLGVSRGVISRNLASLTKLMPGVMGKWVAFLQAVRARWGLSLSRAVAMKKAERDGKFDAAGYDAFLNTLLGLDQQQEHDDGVRAELNRILALDENVADDDIPFSIGRSNERLDGAGMNGGIKTNQPGGANIGDAASPSSASLRAAKAGFPVGPLYRGAENQKDAWDFGESGAHFTTDFYYAREYTNGNEDGLISVYANPGRVLDIGSIADESKSWEDFETSLAKAGVPLETPAKLFRWSQNVKYRDTKTIGDALAALKEDYSFDQFQKNLNNNFTDELGKAIFPLGFDSIKTWEFENREKPVWIIANRKSVADEDNFNQPPPADSGAFSTGPADVAGIMAGNALKRIADPRRRTQAMSRIARDFESIRLQVERMLALSGRKMGKAELRQAANAREDLNAEEAISAIHARYGSLLADDDLVKIKAQPVHAYLADPTSPLRGRLMSKAAAIKAHPERYALHRAGEYDGSDGISRAVFGGQNMPDQAAQELYDHGLISEPTPDAMWNALAAEQNSVGKMKELLARATEEIRQAKKDAKAEATAWLNTQSKGQESTFSQKEEILRALRMLDAILMAMPPEVRGAVGGYTQMARIATDDARLAFLKDKLAKADKELESFLRKEFAAEMEALLRKAAPAKNDAGQRPTGAIDADVYDVFRIAEAAMSLDFVKGEALADMHDAIADNPDSTPAEVDKARVTAQMVRLMMNWTRADAARMEQAVIEADRLYFMGLAALGVKNSRRRAYLGTLRDSAIAGTGKSGGRMERVKAMMAEKTTALGKVKALAWEFMSFGQVVNVLFGEDSAAAKWMTAKELAAANAYEDGFQMKANALEAMFESLSRGKFAGEKLRFRMANERNIRVTDSLGNEHTFSDSEAITFLLMWRQEDGQRHMRGIQDEDGNTVSAWAWDDAAAVEVERQLSDDGKNLMAFLGASYGEEYGRINAVFRNIWNVSMPRHKMYAPLSVAPAQAKGDTIMDPMSGDTMGVGMTPGSLKNRSNTAVAQPEFKDAFQIFLQHARQMEHFIAYGEYARDALAIINRRESRNAIEAAGGPEAAQTLSKWIDYFAQGGIQNAAAGGAGPTLVGRILSRASQAALVGRISVLAMQSLQLGAASYKMPLGAYVSRMARLLAGNLEWGDAIRSEYIQRRILQMPPVVRDAVMGLESGRPNQLKHLVAKAGQSIAVADGIFTGGTYAILYDYHLKMQKQAGNPEPEKAAHAMAELLTDQIAQPTRGGAKSMWEIKNAGNPSFRALWNFASDPRQKVALVIYEMMRRDKKGGEKAVLAGKGFALTWVVSGILQSVLRAVMRDMREDDDDEVFDERHWDLTRLGLQAATGPVGALPFFGDMIEDSTYAATGQYMPQGGLLSGVTNAAKLTPKWLRGDLDLTKDAETLFTGGAAVSGTSAAAASVMHAVRDAIGIVENFMPD